MKYLFSILLLALFVLPQCCKIAVFALFEWQQPLIAQTECVQKAIPDNTCQGKCYLHQQLDKINTIEQAANTEDTTDKNKSTKNKKTPPLFLYSTPIMQLNTLQKWGYSSSVLPIDIPSIWLSTRLPSSLWRPPIVA